MMNEPPNIADCMYHVSVALGCLHLEREDEARAELLLAAAALSPSPSAPWAERWPGVDHGLPYLEPAVEPVRRVSVDVVLEPEGPRVVVSVICTRHAGHPGASGVLRPATAEESRRALLEALAALPALTTAQAPTGACGGRAPLLP